MGELVSVIVPSYNHGRFLEKRLLSIYNQKYIDFEVILLDDCSTDDSREILEKYRAHPKTTHVVFNEVNSGSTFTQWRKGISLARGKYIWIAESDDYCDLSFLEVATEVLGKGSDLFYSKSVRIDEKGEEITHNPYHWYNDISTTRWLSDYDNDAREEVREFLFKKCIINNASAVVFKNEPRIFRYLDVVNGMFYSGDWLFWIQYLLDSGRISYSTKTNNFFRTHAGVTRLKTPVKRNPEILRIYKYIGQQPLSEKNRDMLAQYFFDTHIFKGAKREVGKNLILAFRMCFSSWRFIGPWFRFYFAKSA